MSGWVKPRNLHSSMNNFIRNQAQLFGMGSGSRIWFVDGVNGSDSYSGRDEPKNARAILSTVLGTTSATATDGANAWDVVYVLPKGISGTDPDPYQEASFNLNIPYANQGMAIIGVSSSGLGGRPWDPQIKGHSSATTAVLAVHAPQTHIENLAFNRGGSTTGGIAFYDEGDTTDQAQGSTVYNCYFRNVRGPNAAAGNGGGALFVKGGWNYHFERTFFFNCRHGIVIVSGSASTVQSVIINDAWFSCTAVTNVGVNVYSGSSGTSNLEMTNLYMPHATPNLTSGDNRYIKITASEVGGVVNGYFGTSGLTFGTAGTGVICPATFLVTNCYSGPALMAAA